MHVAKRLLRRHVKESNLIERIRAQPGSPLFDSHFLAAKAVVEACRRGDFLDPTEIHAILCRKTRMEPFGGKVRTCGVRVGRKRCPMWQKVPDLLVRWERLVLDSLDYLDMQPEPPYVRALIAQTIHDELLCIHPFEDGNGRTARLFLNQLRLRYGLDWQVIEEREKYGYYAWIADTEKWYKRRHRDAYE